jgi:hypothetical protein
MSRIEGVRPGRCRCEVSANAQSFETSGEQIIHPNSNQVEKQKGKSGRQGRKSPDVLFHGGRRYSLKSLSFSATAPRTPTVLRPRGEAEQAKLCEETRGPPAHTPPTSILPTAGSRCCQSASERSLVRLLDEQQLISVQCGVIKYFCVLHFQFRRCYEVVWATRGVRFFGRRGFNGRNGEVRKQVE